MELKSNKLQAKDLINVGIFTAIYFVIFFAGMMLGYIPIFIPLLGLVCPILCGIPFAVLNKGQEVWHGIPDRHYPWLAEFNHGQRCVGSDFWHHLWGPGRCNFAGRKISKLEVYAPW